MTGFSQLQNDLQNIFVDDNGSGVPSSEFTSILPTAINYAEKRIYNKMDFLYLSQTDSSTTFTIGNRAITLPSTIKIVESVSVITPAGNTPSAGTRITLERVSQDFLDMSWPTEATTGVPQYFTLKDDTVALVAPTPAAAYKCEVVGVFQPTALSVSNSDTYLTTNYYSLMLAACCVFMAGWQKDFGAQTDDPQMAGSWETQYQKLEMVAMQDAIRQKSEMPGGTSYTVTPSSQKGS